MAYDGPKTAAEWKAEYLKSLEMLSALGRDLVAAEKRAQTLETELDSVRQALLGNLEYDDCDLTTEALVDRLATAWNNAAAQQSSDEDSLMALRSACDDHLRWPDEGAKERGEYELAVLHTSELLGIAETRVAELSGRLDPSAVPVDVHESGWQWRPVGDGAVAPPFGTVRICRCCGCLVAGGPTACKRCVRDGVAK